MGYTPRRILNRKGKGWYKGKLEDNFLIPLGAVILFLILIVIAVKFDARQKEEPTKEETYQEKSIKQFEGRF